MAEGKESLRSLSSSRSASETQLPSGQREGRSVSLSAVGLPLETPRISLETTAANNGSVEPMDEAGETSSADRQVTSGSMKAGVRASVIGTGSVYGGMEILGSTFALDGGAKAGAILGSDGSYVEDFGMPSPSEEKGKITERALGDQSGDEDRGRALVRRGRQSRPLMVSGNQQWGGSSWYQGDVKMVPLPPVGGGYPEVNSDRGYGGLVYKDGQVVQREGDNVDSFGQPLSKNVKGKGVNRYAGLIDHLYQPEEDMQRAGDDFGYLDGEGAGDSTLVNFTKKELEELLSVREVEGYNRGFGAGQKNVVVDRITPFRPADVRQSEVPPNAEDKRTPGEVESAEEVTKKSNKWMILRNAGLGAKVATLITCGVVGGLNVAIAAQNYDSQDSSNRKCDSQDSSSRGFWYKADAGVLFLATAVLVGDLSKTAYDHFRPKAKVD